MAVYFFTGKLGSGKTLCAVGRIRDYLREGRKVATNLDLDLSALARKRRDYRWNVTRLPDKPRITDLQALGRGCEEEDEKRYGLIVLDELGTWFNARKWQDKDRLPLIDWFLHARKHHWDVIFIVQDIDAVDAQLRGALCEHLVIARRLDRLAVPILGALLKLFEIPAKLPKVHVATVRYGDSVAAPVVHRWVYTGKDLYPAYDTAQVFRDGSEVMAGELVDMRAMYSLLSPYHLHGCQRLHRAQDELKEAQAAYDQAIGKKKPHRPSRAAGRPVRRLFVGALSLSFAGALVYAILSRAPAVADTTPAPASLPAPAKHERQEPALSPLDRLLTTSILRTRGIVSDGDRFYGVLDVYDKKNVLVTSVDLRHLYAAGWSVTRGMHGIIIHSGDHAIPVPLV